MTVSPAGPGSIGGAGGGRRPIAEARALFPGAGRRPYFDVAVRSLLAAPVRAAVDRFLDAAMEGGPDKETLFGVVERGRERFARWIGAEPDEVAWTRNVTDGLNLFLGSLDWRAGDEVVFCPELEHPANVLPWRNLAARRGVRLVAVPAAESGRLPSERLAEAVTPRTRVIAAATVSFAPGFRADLGPLREASRASGALLVLDAAQSVGVLRTEVRESGAEVLAVATQKGLAAFYGTGFLYCRREVAESLAPAALGRFGVWDGEAGETEIPERGLPYAPGARRFDLGNYNYPGAVAAERALALLGEFGAAEIEAHAVGLAGELAEGLAGLGLPVVGGAGAGGSGGGGEAGAEAGVGVGGRSHLVAVGAPGRGGHRSAEDPRLEALHRRFREAGVGLSLRRGVLRFSCHLWNDRSEVERVLEVAADFVRSTGFRRDRTR